MPEWVMRKKSGKELKAITEEVVRQILDNGHLHINKIILYGSYARGDADDESDIDIMILCDDGEEEANAYSSEIFCRVDRVAFNHDIMIQTNVKNEAFFEQWAEDLPFYANVKKEGILLYGK